MKREQAEKVAAAVEDFVQALILMDQSDYASDAVAAGEKRLALISILCDEEPSTPE